MATHELKIAPKWYEDVARWVKNFEIRNCEDREFKVGDTLILREWDRGKHTDRPPLVRTVEYVYKGDGTYGLSKEWCILGMKKEPKRCPLEEVEERSKHGNCKDRNIH